MIEHIWTEFSPLQLPVETQYRLAFSVSLLVFLAAAFVLETVKSPGWRWMARVAGAAAFFAISGYAKYVTEENKELSYELLTRQQQSATMPVAKGIMQQTATPVSFETKSGNLFTIGRVKDAGRTGAMCIVSGQRGRQDRYQAAEVRRCRCGNQCVCDCGCGVDGCTNRPAELHRGQWLESEREPAYGNGDSF